MEGGVSVVRRHLCFHCSAGLKHPVVVRSLLADHSIVDFHRLIERNRDFGFRPGRHRAAAATLESVHQVQVARLDDIALIDFVAVARIVMESDGCNWIGVVYCTFLKNAKSRREKRGPYWACLNGLGRTEQRTGERLNGMFSNSA